MSDSARTWVTWAGLGLLAGLALGVAIGWWLWPVTYTNTNPAVLRQDYRADYVLMVATAYDVERDLEQAREYLRALDPQEPAAPVVRLAEQLVEDEGDAEDITHLARLAWALGVTTPSLTPYLAE